MKIRDAVQGMTKQYLRRIVDSFTEDVPPKEEEEARTTIIQHADDLSDEKRIDKRLLNNDLSYPDRLLHRFILESILNRPTWTATDNEIYQSVRTYEEEIIKTSNSEDCFEHTEERSIDILRTVLNVAIEDQRLSMEELRLLASLRKKIGLGRREEHLLLAQLGHFPRDGNELHGPQDVNRGLRELQYAGVVFYCNHHPDGPRFVIPDELGTGVKDAIGFELSDEAWDLLLNKLTKKQLKIVLNEHDAPLSGRKDELIARVMHIGVAPSESLALLSNQELYDILDGLAGAKVSGTKQERIDRIVDYFAKLTIRDQPEGDDPREIYYEYLVELAHRDRENLYANEIISKDLDMEHAFEKGTRFLFEEKLGIELVGMDGSENPDGCLRLDRKGLLMWDNKSKEDIYTFPNSHVRQFNRYIRETTDRVACFLIVVPDVDDAARRNMYKLKQKSPDDTDVAIMTAEDLKWVAEHWSENGGSTPFDPAVFNLTDILDRQMLETRIQDFH